MSNYWHNKGQEDRANDRGYNEPHGILEDLLTWTDSGMRGVADDNSQYRKGWNHADEQDDD